MAPGAARGREVPVQVDEDRARDMGVVVFAAAALRLADVPADIRDPKVWIAEASRDGNWSDER